jgi:V8-like Glu-specific endopeptidase
MSEKIDLAPDAPGAVLSGASPLEAWRELKLRSARKDEDLLPEDARARAAEKSVSLYGKPRAELAGLTGEQIYDALSKEQLRLYGVDERFDLHEVKALDLERAVKDRIMEAAAAVAMLVREDDLEPLPGGRFRLRTKNFGVSYKLCTKEPFRDQPIVGFCSGVLVGPKLIATAGHCARDERRLKSTRFIFGFRTSGQANQVWEVDAAQVYEPEGFAVERVEDPASGSDWALVKLKRPVELTIDGNPVKPARLRRDDAKIGDRTQLSVIGHPCGLPCKYAGGATVRENGREAFFKANLDTFGGNSGSPVFDEKHEVVGLLVRGQRDFTELRSEADPQRNPHWCVRSLIYPAVSAGEIDETGEGCTRASEFVNHVPKVM